MDDENTYANVMQAKRIGKAYPNLCRRGSVQQDELDSNDPPLRAMIQ